MSSKIKENLLFYLSSTREKSRLIGIGHDLNLKNDLIIKLLIKNCRFKFDLLLLNSLKSNFIEFKFDNIYTLNYEWNELNLDEEQMKKQIKKLEQSIKNIFPDSCLIIDSINQLILNLNPIELNKFFNYLLSKYSKLIFIFNNDIIDLDYLIRIQELCSSYFDLQRDSFKQDILVNYIYKKKCQKFGLDLLKGDYGFSFDQNTLSTKLKIVNKNLKDKNEKFFTELSFNPSINEEDKQREKNVLPFIRYLD